MPIELKVTPPQKIWFPRTVSLPLCQRLSQRQRKRKPHKVMPFKHRKCLIPRCLPMVKTVHLILKYRLFSSSFPPLQLFEFHFLPPISVHLPRILLWLMRQKWWQADGDVLACLPKSCEFILNNIMWIGKRENSELPSSSGIYATHIHIISIIRRWELQSDLQI